MFKLGVLSTVIMLILFLTAKGVFIGLMLLMINFGFIVAKLASLKVHAYGYQGWSPPQKDIHVHIHNPDPTKTTHHELPFTAFANGVEAAGPWSTSGYNVRRQQPAYTSDYGDNGADTVYLPQRKRIVVPINYNKYTH